jgi:hypothetical protein
MSVSTAVISCAEIPANNSEIIDFIKTHLKKLDLSPIAYQLMYSGWSREQTVKAITKYMMFMCLIHSYPNVALVPTQEIDKIWHTHILDTEKYAADCQMLFGHFIHHYPYFGMGNESEEQAKQAAFIQTQLLMNQHFGKMAVDDVSLTTSVPPSCKLTTQEKLQFPHIDLGEVYSFLV